MALFYPDNNQREIHLWHVFNSKLGLRHHLGDNCIQKCHLERQISRFTVRYFALNLQP